MFMKMTAKSKVLLGRPEMAQFVKMPFIVFLSSALNFHRYTYSITLFSGPFIYRDACILEELQLSQN